MLALKKSTPGTKSVGSGASVELLATNLSRKFAVISNPTAAGMFLAFGQSAVIGYGVYIPPGGGYQIDKDNMWQGAVNGIMATGGAVTISTEDQQ